ncbi:MAG: IS4 family transposase, partial [Gammaproteobacteria bacterium]|nr:IS4 family transposase [Gammaproteobacteria bacterium]
DEVMLHPTIALTPERVCLGVVQADIWERTGKSPRSKRRYKPFEEKESAYWVDGYQSDCAIQGLAPETQIISVGDAESDIYELYLEYQEYESATRADWIVRAAQDRCLDTNNKFENKIRSCMKKKWVLGTATVTVPARGDCKARKAVLTIRAGRVTLKAPRRAGFKPENVSVNVVFASEENPPPDVDEPLDWLLLTSLPVCTFEQACAVLSNYACRWEIEIYFRVLKQGCGVEKLQFEEDRRYANCLAIYMIIARRVLYLTMAGRANPDADCEIVFSKAEWQILYILTTKEPPPAVPPTFSAAIGMLARFGGFLGRKHDGFPGPMCIWTGLQRLRDFVLAAHSRQMAAAMAAAGTADTCV